LASALVEEEDSHQVGAGWMKALGPGGALSEEVGAPSAGCLALFLSHCLMVLLHHPAVLIRGWTERADLLL